MTAALLVCFTMLALAAAAHARPRPAERAQLVRVLAGSLKGTPLYGHVAELEQAGRRHHVHPAFIAAAAGLESAWGRLPCRGNPRNVWGLGSCDRAWHVPHFDTWADAFDYYARFVAGRWPTARTPYDLHGYCQCGAAYWGSRVAWNMRRLGFPPVVRYP